MVCCGQLGHRARSVLLAAGWWLAGVAVGGCAGTGTRAPVSLEAPEPQARVRAIVEVVERNDRSAVPALVDRLEDEDEAVRFYAIMALEKLTGTRLGYHYGGSDAVRRAGVERWRRYVRETWSQQHRGRPAGNGKEDRGR